MVGALKKGSKVCLSHSGWFYIFARFTTLRHFKLIAVSQESKELYVVPAKFRKLENLHILFWLVKDLCWCLLFKPLGMVMIAPTLLVAVWITWKNRHNVAELAHNLAISIWIMANSMWMVAEFYSVDEKVKPYCIIPFSIGILILLYYYLIYAPLQRRKENAEAGQVVVAPTVAPVGEES